MTYRYRHSEMHQQEDDLPAGRIIVVWLAGLAICGILTVAALSLSLASEASIRPSLRFPERDLGPRRPVRAVLQRLFEEPPLAEILTERQNLALESYGWVDPRRRTVRIPIDRAMKLVAEGGRP